MRSPLGLSEPWQDDSLKLAEQGSAERWQQLQRLRRGLAPLEPLLTQLLSGELAPEADLLAALWRRLDRSAVERLLAGPLAADPAPLLLAARQELVALVGDSGVREAWLEPLLACPPRPPWLELLGYFRDPRVAAHLRQAINESAAELAPALLPLLGQQRQAQDAELLARIALQPGPRLIRRAALEGLAVGLSAWPPSGLRAALLALAQDLDPALAGQAVDLLARLPDGQQQLRVLAERRLDSDVAARLQRRLLRSPLVLVVHGRQGGAIPEVLHDLASDLGRRRGAPVLIQALTGAQLELPDRCWRAAQGSGAITLVPLLLLPGEHVRRDLPEIAAGWRRRLARPAGGQPVLRLRRRPFLGAWPGWQRLLRLVLQNADAGRGLIWLHHPLQGPLSQRFLQHLEGVLQAPGRPTGYGPEAAAQAVQQAGGAVLAPLTLAPNRLSESLNMVALPPAAAVLPPLLDLPPVREFLLASLESLP